MRTRWSPGRGSDAYAAGCRGTRRIRIVIVAAKATDPMPPSLRTSARCSTDSAMDLRADGVSCRVGILLDIFGGAEWERTHYSGQDADAAVGTADASALERELSSAAHFVCLRVWNEGTVRKWCGLAGVAIW
jgi:hypothetical protein